MFSSKDLNIDFQEFYTQIHYNFLNYDFLKKILLHSSKYPSNTFFQHFELIGDKLLSLIVTKTLLAKNPQPNEACLSQISSLFISGEYISQISKELQLKNYIEFYGNEKILIYVCKALIAAIFYDGGILATEKFVLSHWNFDNKITLNYKFYIQEWCQKNRDILPNYTYYADQKKRILHAKLIIPHHKITEDQRQIKKSSRITCSA